MRACVCSCVCDDNFIMCLLGSTYDAKKETKEAREKKQNQLKKIEEAKKREEGMQS